MAMAHRLPRPNRRVCLAAVLALLIVLSLLAMSSLSVKPWQVELITPKVFGTHCRARLVSAKGVLSQSIYLNEVTRNDDWGLFPRWRRDIHMVDMAFFEIETGTSMGHYIELTTNFVTPLFLTCLTGGWLYFNSRKMRAKQARGFEVR
jgi:hypothetical protein